jgi:hypothetical protein
LLEIKREKGIGNLSARGPSHNRNIEGRSRSRSKPSPKRFENKITQNLKLNTSKIKSALNISKESLTSGIQTFNSNTLVEVKGLENSKGISNKERLEATNCIQERNFKKSNSQGKSCFNEDTT